MRDSVQIEQLAVAHITTIFASCRRITPWINKGDKEPMWDGALYIYKGEDHSNDFLLGRVHCQVKGKETSENPGTITYYLTRPELLNYQRDGGVLFMVVHIEHPNKPSYWAHLTPIELQEYLDKAKEQKGINIELVRMPDITECECQLIEFYRHCQRQKRPAIDVDQAFKPMRRIQVFGIPQSELPPIIELSKGYHYLYSCDKDGKDTYPVGNTQFSLSFSRNVTNEVIIGEKKFVLPVELVTAKGSSYLKVGSFLRIDLIKADGASCQLSYSADNVHLVRERALALHVLLAMDEADSLIIKEISFSCSEVSLSTEKRSSIIEELKSCERIITLLDRLHIAEDLDVYALSDADRVNLKTIYEGIIENRPVKLKRADDNTYITWMKVGTLAILLWLVRKDGELYIEDFFGHQEYYVAVGGNGTDEKFPVSRFAVLGKDDYVRYSNIDWSLFPDDYKCLDLNNPLVAEQVTKDALNLLSAYDESGRDEILQAALRLTGWLVEIENSVIYRINNLQTIKRLRSLTKEEIEEVYGYVEKEDASPELRFCCDLLLDDIHRAEYHFSLMDLDVREYYKTLPIMKFWKSEEK